MTQSMFLVLVVEDDAGIRGVLRTLLESQHYRVTEVVNASRAVIEARSRRPDLIIVDLGLPDGDGLSVIQQVRQFSPVPILVLSARSMESDKIAALDAGADDYVTKPFSTPELLARVRAAFRRAARGAAQAPLLHFGPLRVDLSTRTAIGAERSAHLTPLEYRVLECLARNAGMIVTQRQLMAEVWGGDRQGDTQGLRSYVKQLRQKLEPDPRRPRFLLTEAGVGYRLHQDDSPANHLDPPLP